jgi:hypothetical protein
VLFRRFAPWYALISAEELNKFIRELESASDHQALERIWPTVGGVPELARADTRVRPSIDQTECLVGRHLCMPPEGGRNTMTDPLAEWLAF